MTDKEAIILEFVSCAISILRLRKMAKMGRTGSLEALRTEEGTFTYLLLKYRMEISTEELLSSPIISKMIEETPHKE